MLGHFRVPRGLASGQCCYIRGLREPHAFPNTYTDANTNPHANAYTNTYAYCNSDSNAHAGTNHTFRAWLQGARGGHSGPHLDRGDLE